MVTSCSRSRPLVPHLAPAPACGHPNPSVTAPIPSPAGVPPIGKVVFLTHKNEWAEAILDGEGRWFCPKLPVLDRVLNTLHEPKRESGNDLPFGQAELIRVAAWLKGVVRREHS